MLLLLILVKIARLKTKIDFAKFLFCKFLQISCQNAGGVV